MRHRKTPPRGRVIRKATPKDRPWIRQVAATVYSDFGDYSEIIPAWLNHPGVLTFVEENDAGERRGFILIGFYEADDESSGVYVADLLAIAVAPGHQGQGVGRRLLKQAVDISVLAAQRMPVREVRLTVADSNVRAQGLFRTEGFEVFDDRHGMYDGGQTALRMRRPIPQPTRRWGDDPDED